MWTVAMTKANCENVAAVNLQRQNYVYYLPRFKSAQPNGKVVTKILFPRYIFVHIEDKWYSLLGTYGISKVLVLGGKPQAVSDSIIMSLKAKEGPDGFISLQTKARFLEGEKVKVAEGPLSGYSMLYDGMSNHLRARVLIDMLGRQVSMSVDEKALIAA